MLLGQSSPLRGDLGGGEMPAPDEVTAVVGGCTNWLKDEANCRRVGAARTGEASSCGERYRYCSSLMENCGVHHKCRANKAGKLSEASVRSLTYPAGYLA